MSKMTWVGYYPFQFHVLFLSQIVSILITIFFVIGLNNLYALDSSLISSKTHFSPLSSSFILNIREYSMTMSHLASKLTSLKLEMLGYFLVHLVLISILALFRKIKV